MNEYLFVSRELRRRVIWLAINNASEEVTVAIFSVPRFCW
jgi:hypothetical protein